MSRLLLQPHDNSRPVGCLPVTFALAQYSTEFGILDLCSIRDQSEIKEALKLKLSQIKPRKATVTTR